MSYTLCAPTAEEASSSLASHLLAWLEEWLQEQVKDVLFEAMGAPPHEGPELDDFLALFSGMSRITLDSFEDALDDFNTKHGSTPQPHTSRAGHLCVRG